MIIHILLITGKIFIASYLAFAVLFYLFLKSLLIQPENSHPIISVHSWHYKLAYPFRRHHVMLEEIKFFRYSLKLFLMIFLGWPILIVWETLKFIIYNPFLILFGAYSTPDLYGMWHNAEHPFYTRISLMYVPRKIYPIYLLAAGLLGWAIYKWTVTVLVILAVIIIVVAFIALLVYLIETERFKPFIDWVQSVRAKSTNNFIVKYNYKIVVQRRDDED